jgi:sucrose-6-phosphate hydrolase SacC (GH32 family)
MRLKFPKPNHKPDGWYSADLREFKGRKVILRYRSSEESVLENLELSNKEIIDPNAYDGPHRPRFHFSPRIGWMNDINGTYYQDGLYHLFYQYNPTTSAWSTGFDMHWGHSVSKDLIHWEEWPIALFPDATGDVFSGTAVMIENHILGVNDGAPLPTPALFFTGTTPFSQHFATTRDGGKTFQRYPQNPVLPKTLDSDRDPKVIWHEESQHYIMVLYVGEPKHYYIYRSKDLTNWEQTQILPHWYECPEFFQVKSPTTGKVLWLLYGCYQTPENHPNPFAANSVYQLGEFDGKNFIPVTEIKHAHRGPNFYAALTFVNAPDDRKIMMGWTRDIHSPGEPFNQAATLPLNLQLKDINGEDTLCFEPATEVDALRGEPILSLRNITGSEAREKLSSLSKEASLEVAICFEKDIAQPLQITIRNKRFTYDPASGKINDDRPIHPSGALEARFMIDRSLIESFWNGGEAAYCHGSLHTDEGPAFDISDETKISELTIYPLQNIWK